MDKNDIEGGHSLLTTIDNPINPHNNYELWREKDRALGYYTEEAIARNIPLDRKAIEDDLEQQLVLDRAYDLVIEEDPFGVYVFINHDGSIDVSDMEEQVENII